MTGRGRIALALMMSMAAGCSHRVGKGARVGFGLLAPMAPMVPGPDRSNGYDPTAAPLPMTENPFDETAEVGPEAEVQVETERTVAALLVALANWKLPMVGIFGSW